MSFDSDLILSTMLRRTPCDSQVQNRHERSRMFYTQLTVQYGVLQINHILPKENAKQK